MQHLFYINNLKFGIGKITFWGKNKNKLWILWKSHIKENWDNKERMERIFFSEMSFFFLTKNPFNVGLKTHSFNVLKR